MNIKKSGRALSKWDDNQAQFHYYSKYQRESESVPKTYTPYQILFVRRILPLKYNNFQKSPNI